jgi:hypothetical protein
MAYDKARSVVWQRALIRVMSIRVVMIGGAHLGGISHRLNQAETIFGLGTAALAIQALTLASISGRLLDGRIVMYLPLRGFTIGCDLLQGFGLGIIGIADDARYFRRWVQVALVLCEVIY